MNTKALVIATTIAIGAPTLALAQGAPPIHIDSTFIMPSFPNSAGITPGFAYVRFENETRVPVTEVDFALEAKGRPVQTFRDVGTYTAGNPVEHRFNFPLADARRDQTISVARVSFADGTSWSNGQALTGGRRQSQ